MSRWESRHPLTQQPLTVGEVATAFGLTVRTLHHWDDIGLATPSLRAPSGYRLYTADDLDRLQLQQLNAGLQRMITAHEEGLLLTDEQQQTIIGEQWDPRWPTDARRQYGDTAQWRQFAERAASRSPEDWQQIVAEVNDLDRSMADALAAGVEPGSAAADALVERHREVFSAYFPLTRQMQVCLGRMYESDPGYAAHYDGIGPGLAEWFRHSVDANARTHGIDPDTATWQ